MKDNVREIFAKNLQYQIDRTGKEQADIVRDLGYKQPTVSDWFRGKKYPRPDKMEELAEYFNISISDLTDEKPATDEGDGLNDIQREAMNAMLQLDPADMEIVKNLAVSLAKKHNQE